MASPSRSSLPPLLSPRSGPFIMTQNLSSPSRASAGVSAPSPVVAEEESRWFASTQAGTSIPEMNRPSLISSPALIIPLFSSTSPGRPASGWLDVEDSGEPLNLVNDWSPSSGAQPLLQEVTFHVESGPGSSRDQTPVIRLPQRLHGRLVGISPLITPQNNVGVPFSSLATLELPPPSLAPDSIRALSSSTSPGPFAPVPTHDSASSPRVICGVRDGTLSTDPGSSKICASGGQSGGVGVSTQAGTGRCEDPERPADPLQSPHSRSSGSGSTHGSSPRTPSPSSTKCDGLCRDSGGRHSKLLFFCNTRFTTPNRRDTVGVRFHAYTDVLRLPPAFEEMGYDVEVFTNLSHAQLNYHFETIRDRDFTGYNHVVVMVTSHGHGDTSQEALGYMEGVDGEYASLELMCPLSEEGRLLSREDGVPFFIFVQLCRTPMEPSPVHSSSQRMPPASVLVSSLPSFTSCVSPNSPHQTAMPLAGNLAIVYSSPRGSQSFRGYNGSYMLRGLYHSLLVRGWNAKWLVVLEDMWTTVRDMPVGGSRTRQTPVVHSSTTFLNQFLVGHCCSDCVAAGGTIPSLLAVPLGTPLTQERDYVLQRVFSVLHVYSDHPAIICQTLEALAGFGPLTREPSLGSTDMLHRVLRALEQHASHTGVVNAALDLCASVLLQELSGTIVQCLPIWQDSDSLRASPSNMSTRFFPVLMSVLTVHKHDVSDFGVARSCFRLIRALLLSIDSESSSCFGLHWKSVQAALVDYFWESAVSVAVGSILLRHTLTASAEFMSDLLHMLDSFAGCSLIFCSAFVMDSGFERVLGVLGAFLRPIVRIKEDPDCPGAVVVKRLMTRAGARRGPSDSVVQLLTTCCSLLAQLHTSCAQFGLVPPVNSNIAHLRTVDYVLGVLVVSLEPRARAAPTTAAGGCSGLVHASNAQKSAIKSVCKLLTCIEDNTWNPFQIRSFCRGVTGCPYGGLAMLLEASHTLYRDDDQAALLIAQALTAVFQALPLANEDGSFSLEAFGAVASDVLPCLPIWTMPESHSVCRSLLNFLFRLLSLGPGPSSDSSLERVVTDASIALCRLLVLHCPREERLSQSLWGLVNLLAMRKDVFRSLIYCLLASLVPPSTDEDQMQYKHECIQRFLAGNGLATLLHSFPDYDCLFALFPTAVRLTAKLPSLKHLLTCRPPRLTPRAVFDILSSGDWECPPVVPITLVREASIPVTPPHGARPPPLDAAFSLPSPASSQSVTSSARPTPTRNPILRTFHGKVKGLSRWFGSP